MTTFDWTQLHPAHSPPARFFYSMCLDPVRERVVLFGGQKSLSTPDMWDDTWEWDGSDWEEQFPSTVPTSASTISYLAMTYDGTTGQIMLGGVSGTAPYSLYFWLWDGSDWTSIAAPPVTVGHALGGWTLGYLPGINRTHFYVSHDFAIIGNLNTHMYEWDGATWTDLGATAGGPVDNIPIVWSYDPDLGAYIFSALGAPNLFKTYQWDGATWSAVPGASPGVSGDPAPPENRAAAGEQSAVFMAVLDGVVQYVGNYPGDWYASRTSAMTPTGGGNYGWAATAPAHDPGDRGQYALAENPNDGYVILFGGFEPHTAPSSILDDTWIYAPAGPDVVTGPADDTSCIAALLSGTISPNTLGSLAWHFEVGTAPASYSITSVGGAISGFAPIPLSEAISGLTGGTTYYYVLMCGPVTLFSFPGPTLPLVVVAGVNDQFTYTAGAGLGTPEVFTVAAGTYTTLADVIAALAAALGSVSSEAFSTIATPSDGGSGGILFTMLDALGAEGNTISAGPNDIGLTGGFFSIQFSTFGDEESFVESPCPPSLNAEFSL